MGGMQRKLARAGGGEELRAGNHDQNGLYAVEAGNTRCEGKSGRYNTLEGPSSGLKIMTNMGSI